MSITIIERDGAKFFPVNTTNGADVPENAVLLTANVRETKGNPCPAERKHRNIVIPCYSVPESIPKAFQPVLLDKFYTLAKEYLETVMEQTDRMAKEIPVEDFSIDKLLSFFQRVAVSNRITGESVAAWFDASATGKHIASKVDAAKLKKYRDLFVKTASPNHGINPNTCTVLLTTLQEADKESTIYEALATRWNATIQKSKESEVDAL